MQNQTYFKTVLRNLGSNDCRAYLATQKQKRDFGYPRICIPQPEKLDQNPLMIAISYFAYRIKFGYHVQLCLLDYNNILYRLNGIVDNGAETNIVQTLPQGFIKISKKIQEQQLQNINSFIKNKILVGHDLADILNILQISHSAIIDTLALYPHNIGLPLKSTLQNISLKVYNKTLPSLPLGLEQHAKTALSIVNYHIKQGLGTIQQTQAIKLQIKGQINYQQILLEAQLDKDRVTAFFLRGSRALNLTIQEQQYISDWDYLCVYKSDIEIDGKLIKLWNVDVTIYDQKSFQKLMVNNDISLLQLFFLPMQFQFINKLNFPKLDNLLIRKSLDFHLAKCDHKIKRFQNTLTGGKREWKILKTYHMKIRFIHYFIQIYYTHKIQFTPIIELWQSIADAYRATKDFNKGKKDLQNIESIAASLRKIDREIKNARKSQMKCQKKYNKKFIKQQKNCIVEKQQIYHIHQSENSKIDQFIKNPLKLQLINEVIQFGLQRMEHFRISYNRHKFYPNLIQFHYNSSSDFKLKICRQSRGIILDQYKGYQIVALPYMKFFDYNDKKFSQIEKFDFNQFKIYQKFDGSIACLYQYEGKWQVSSSRVPDGTNQYCFAKSETTKDFKKQFCQIAKQYGYSMPDENDRNKTFIFQLLSKDHIIVVHREFSSLVLHGVVDRITGRQQDHIPYALKYKWEYAKPLQLNINSLSQVVDHASSINPLKQEGFVLCDHNFVRLKVKNAHYIKINWLAELNLTPDKNPRKYILDIVIQGQAELFLKYCPEWSYLIQLFLENIYKLNVFCYKFYEKYCFLKQKQLADTVRKYQSFLHPFLFAICRAPQKWKNRLHHLLSSKKLLQCMDQIGSNNLQQL